MAFKLRNSTLLGAIFISFASLLSSIIFIQQQFGPRSSPFNHAIKGSRDLDHLYINAIPFTTTSNATIIRENQIPNSFEGLWTDCPSAPSIQEDRRNDKKMLKFVTYNAEWLFLKGGYGSMVHCPSRNCPWTDIKSARNHLSRVAQILDDLDADLYNLQEVEDCGALHELVQMMSSSRSYRPYMIKGQDVALGQNVGLISKVDVSTDLWRTNSFTTFPVANSTCHQGGYHHHHIKWRKRGKGCAKHYIARFDNILDKPLYIVGVHLLSNPSDYQRCIEREAQLDTLIHELEPYVKDSYLIIAGDFNDFDGSIERLKGDAETDDNNNNIPLIPMSSCLHRVHSKLKVGNVMSKSKLPSHLWYTIKFHSQGELIDHILVSDTLYSRIEEIRIVHEAIGISDHLPILMVLRT